MDYQKEIDQLKKEISEIKKSLPSKNSLFGKANSEIGSSSSDTVIKTLGTVKVKFGNKYVTIFKNGKLSVDESFKFIYKSESVGVKDGIYIIGEDENASIFIVSGGTQIPIKTSDITYVSFIQKQEITPEQKEQALTNIGFLYNDLEEFNSSGINNSIIYVQNERKLYIVENGVPREFQINFPENFEQLTIKKLISEQINLEDTVINSTNINFKNSFNIGNAIFSALETIVSKLNCNNLYGTNYQLIDNGITSSLTIDYVYANNLLSNIPQYTNYDIITSIEIDGGLYNIETLYTTKYKEGDQLLIQTTEYNLVTKWIGNNGNEVQEETEGAKSIQEYKFETKNLYFKISGSKLENISSNFDYSQLKGAFIYLIKRDSKLIPLVKTKGNLQLITLDITIDESGNISESEQLYLSIGTSDLGSGLLLNKNTDNSHFAQYSDESDPIPQDCNDKTLITKEWISNYFTLDFPSGSIISFYGETIPKGWVLCNGQTYDINGNVTTEEGIVTPNLSNVIIIGEGDKTLDDSYLNFTPSGIGTVSYNLVPLKYIMKL